MQSRRLSKSPESKKQKNNPFEVLMDVLLVISLLYYVIDLILYTSRYSDLVMVFGILVTVFDRIGNIKYCDHT